MLGLPPIRAKRRQFYNHNYLDGLWRYFKMEEASGDLLDEVTAENFPVTGSPTYSQTGANNNGIIIPEAANVIINNTPYFGADTLTGVIRRAVSVWANPPDAPASIRYIINTQAAGAGNDDSIYALSGNGNMVFQMVSSHTTGNETINVPQVGSGLRHFVFLWNTTAFSDDPGPTGRRLWCFIDGKDQLAVPSTSGTPKATSSQWDDVVAIGNDGGATNGPDCLLDELSIWEDDTNTWGSYDEMKNWVRQLYNGGDGLFYDSF